MAQESFLHIISQLWSLLRVLDIETSLHFALSCIYPSKKTKAWTLQQSLLGVEGGSKDDVSLDDGWGLVHFLVEDRIANHSRCILHVPQRFVQPGIKHSVEIQTLCKGKFISKTQDWCSKTLSHNLISSIAKLDRNAYFTRQRVYSHWRYSCNQCLRPFLTTTVYGIEI